MRPKQSCPASDGAASEQTRAHAPVDTDFSAKPIPARAHDGRVVGNVVGDALVKQVDARIHKLRTPSAWACDTATLGQADELGAERVVLKDDHAGIIWEAWLTDFYGRRSVLIDRGHGKQRALLLDAWTMRGQGVTRQLSLFGHRSEEVRS